MPPPKILPSLLLRGRSWSDSAAAVPALLSSQNTGVLWAPLELPVHSTALGAAWGKWTPSLLDPVTNGRFLLYLLPPLDFLPPAKYDSCWQYEFYTTRAEGHCGNVLSEFYTHFLTITGKFCKWYRARGKAPLEAGHIHCLTSLLVSSPAIVLFGSWKLELLNLHVC